MLNSFIEFKQLFKLLKYHFNDPQLLEQALTRKSGLVENKQEKSIGHNGRLEFFGDSILRTVIDDILIELHPTDNEAQLSVKRDELVAKEGFLYQAAETISLDKFIIMGNGEAIDCQKNGRKKILSDTMEAIIGAVFLDSDRNYDTIKTFIAVHSGLNLKIQKLRNQQLFEAVKNNNLKKVEYNLKHGANPNVTYGYEFRASSTNRRYTDLNKDAAQLTNYSFLESNALELAICCEDIDFNDERLAIIEMLLRYHANPNKSQAPWESLLHFAINDLRNAFYVHVVQMLLQNGADTSLRDWRELTPLELAIVCTDLTYTQLLLKLGANPNLQNREGQTALHRAFNLTRIPEKRTLGIKLINLLAEYDADLSIKDQQGKTPRDYSKGLILAKGPMYVINSRQVNQLRRASVELDSESESDSKNDVASYCLTM